MSKKTAIKSIRAKVAELDQRIECCEKYLPNAEDAYRRSQDRLLDAVEADRKARKSRVKGAQDLRQESFEALRAAREVANERLREVSRWTDMLATHREDRDFMLRLLGELSL